MPKDSAPKKRSQIVPPAPKPAPLPEQTDAKPTSPINAEEMAADLEAERESNNAYRKAWGLTLDPVIESNNAWRLALGIEKGAPARAELPVLKFQRLAREAAVPRLVDVEQELAAEFLKIVPGYAGPVPREMRAEAAALVTRVLPRVRDAVVATVIETAGRTEFSTIEDREILSMGTSLLTEALHELGKPPGGDDPDVVNCADPYYRLQRLLSLADWTEGKVRPTVSKEESDELLGIHHRFDSALTSQIGAGQASLKRRLSELREAQAVDVNSADQPSDAVLVKKGKPHRCKFGAKCRPVSNAVTTWGKVFTDLSYERPSERNLFRWLKMALAKHKPRPSRTCEVLALAEYGKGLDSLRKP